MTGGSVSSSPCCVSRRALNAVGTPRASTHGTLASGRRQLHKGRDKADGATNARIEAHNNYSVSGGGASDKNRRSAPTLEKTSVRKKGSGSNFAGFAKLEPVTFLPAPDRPARFSYLSLPARRASYIPTMSTSNPGQFDSSRASCCYHYTISSKSRGVGLLWATSKGDSPGWTKATLATN